MTEIIRSFAGMLGARNLLSLTDLDKLMDMAVYGAPSATGAFVSQQSAMSLPAVWSCVDLISASASILPGHVYRRLPAGQTREREVAADHYLYPLIHDKVNPTLPANEWRRIAVSHLLGWGNHYSWIEWTPNKRPKHLWVIPPSKVKIKRESMTAPIQYFIENSQKMQWVEFPAEDILHIRGLGYDGTRGYSPIEMLRETFGLGLAHQQSAAALHKNGFTQRLVLEYPGVMEPAQMTEFKKSFQEANAGLQNAFKAIVLQNGMVAKPFSINPDDAQFLESAKYNDSKIYQIYRVPPHMISDTEKSTSWGTGVEQQTIGFANFTLTPWMDTIETWLAMKLLPDKTEYFIEYDLKGLLRGDTAARAAWYRAMIELGVYNPNRVLSSENEAPYDGGNVYRRPLNTAFVDESGTVVQFTPPGASPGGTDGQGTT